jgi:two-component system phosphate regulon sensor histidine kinase PhoR
LLKKQEQFRKEFLSNVSHEFKTPLFAIQGYIDTLEDCINDDPQPDCGPAPGGLPAADG